MGHNVKKQKNSMMSKQIKIQAIKFETIAGKKTGRSFSFKFDPKKMASIRPKQQCARRLRNMWSEAECSNVRNLVS